MKWNFVPKAPRNDMMMNMQILVQFRERWKVKNQTTSTKEKTQNTVCLAIPCARFRFLPAAKPTGLVEANCSSNEVQKMGLNRPKLSKQIW